MKHVQNPHWRNGRNVTSIIRWPSTRRLLLNPIHHKCSNVRWCRNVTWRTGRLNMKTSAGEFRSIWNILQQSHPQHWETGMASQLFSDETRVIYGPLGQQWHSILKVILVCPGECRESTLSFPRNVGVSNNLPLPITLKTVRHTILDSKEEPANLIEGACPNYL